MEKYRKWLIDQVMDNEGDMTGYALLCLLHKKIYYYYVDYDINRAEDGKKLRIVYLEENQSEIIDIYGECTFLEFLIALAYRASSFTDDGDEETFQDWFWRIIRNTGLLDNMERAADENLVDIIVDNICQRKYDRCGKGGLFPLRKSTHDQRKREVWMQMHDYIKEKCYF